MSLPRALLGCARFVPAGMLFVGRWCVCARVRSGGRGWRFGMLTDCGCAAVFDGMCGWDASVNGIGDAGAVALAKALGSGQCQLKSLNLGCESMCVLPHALLGCAPFVPAGMVFVGRPVVCVRAHAEWRAWVALLGC